MVLFGFKTIQAGEQALVRNHQGDARLVTGPARVTLFRSRVEKLSPYFAADGQFLEVNFRHAARECVPGPVQMFLNPVEVESIVVRDATLVSANEALVIYRSHASDTNHISSKVPADNGKSGFERLILYGPMRYIPRAGEWTHEFSWHGEEPGNKARKVKGALRFTLLRVIADQFYYNVPEVRTKDDTMITVKLMVFFQLVDVNKMLDNTHDPIADFINSVTSDTIQFCSGLSYEEFVDSTSSMNDIKTFSQLTFRAEMIGYKISKVVFRGFHSSDALQSMHDKAIHERTRLRLEADTEDHRQRTLDLQLTKEEERSAKERELERDRVEHRRTMEREAHAEELKKKTEEEDHRLRMLETQLEHKAERAERERQLERLGEEHRLGLERDRAGAKLEMDKKRAELLVSERCMMLDVDRQRLNMEKERVEHLTEMKVDVTKVLVAECHVPDKTIKIDAARNLDANVHIHDTDSFAINTWPGSNHGK